MSRRSTSSSEDEMPLRIGVASDVGPVRDENEDSHGHFSVQGRGEYLFVVADGMGGHAYGKEASTTTVRVIENVYFDRPAEPVHGRLQEAFRRANEVVRKEAQTSKSSRRGTTATALALVQGKAYIAHVGDSRAYRFRSDLSEQLTCDHTLVQQLRRNGTISEEEARTHPRRGTLIRAIGVEPSVEVDLIEIGATQPGDRFLLCTDGLNPLVEWELREVVLNNAPQAACEQLLRRAYEEGSSDNATALVVHRSSL